MSRRRRKTQPRLPLRPTAAVLLVLVCAIGAYTAANAVPTSSAGQDVRAITPNDLKPPACAAITVTALVTGTGTFSGTNAAELVLGSAAVDNISAGRGDDCVLGGGGNDAVGGGFDTDVCIGGPGTDTFTRCETQIQ